jgi:2'-5' RNA ligase
MLEKYFIAIVPSEALLTEIQEIKKDIFEKYQTKGALRSPGHITLHMPFAFEENKEEKLINCLQDFKFNHPFSIELENYACFEPRVIYINVKQQETLTELQKQLVQHVKRNLQLFNHSDDKRGFHPHITVAFRDLKKQNFYTVWEEYKTKNLKASFKCNAICLLKHINDRWEVYREFHIEQ